MSNEKATPLEIASSFEFAHNAGQVFNQAQAEVHQIQMVGKPFIIIETGKMEIKDVEYLAATPTRVRQTVTLSDRASFIRYVNDFKDTGSRIFARFSDTGGSFRAVLDYHNDPVTPRWGNHVAIYACPTTPEWDLWIANNAKALSQDAFSELVEKMRLSFKDPDVATMLEIARTLEASQTGKFESHINPANGNRTLIFKDETTATAGTYKTPIPNSITLLLQPFRRGSMYQVEAGLRYRIAGGKVTFQYDLVRAHEVVETALKEISVEVEEKTLIQPYNGDL